MKAFFFLILFSFSIQASAIGQDKINHFSVSYAVSSTGLYFLPKHLKWLAPVFTLALGAAKELADDHFDGGDMIADGTGVGASLVVLELE